MNNMSDFLFLYVTYVFQGESTLYSCLNAKELLAWNRRYIWSLSDCNGIRIHCHLVRKRTFNHLVKLVNLAKWLIVSLWTKWLWVPIPLQTIQCPLPPNNILHVIYKFIPFFVLCITVFRITCFIKFDMMNFSGDIVSKHSSIFSQEFRLNTHLGLL